MRRSKTISLAEAINDYIREMKMEGKLMEINIIDSWEKFAGRAVASRTSGVTIKDGVLIIHMKSSVVKNELMMIREALKEKINREAGGEIIKDIIIK
jgi:predicted nucleic acid-binding Zn ribbon protein